MDYEQLSFEELLTEDSTTAKQALIPHTDYHLINSREFTFPKKRFFALSVVAHIIIATWALTIVVKKLNSEIIEVEYVSADAAPPAPLAYAPVSTAPTTLMAPSVDSPTQKSLPHKIAAPAAQVLPKEEPREMVKPAPLPKATINAGAVVTSKPQTSPTVPTIQAEPLATVSDIEVPLLADVQDSATPTLETPMLESDFDKIDDSQNAQLLAAAQSDSKILEDSIAELDQTSAVLATEPSDLDTAANEKLQNLKAQKAQLQKATKSAGPSGAPDVSAQALAGERALSQKANRYGNGTNAASDATEAGSGSPGMVGSHSEGIVRKLEDLRQKPGNPKPQYDVQDRMNGLSGTVVVNAYVTKEGSLSMLRLIKSTGHANLDRKTLAALKDWKFYPGQEGWVELPFRWDLKGGVQQKPTLLKRQ